MQTEQQPRTLTSYRTLGRSGLKVSPICLGGMTLGDDWGWGADEAESARIINRYVELGGNFIDTASVYTGGHSEKIIGDTIGKHSSKRTGMVIGTKVSANTFPGNPNTGGTSTRSILENLHQSLRRLQTDYIDLYWVHQWDWNTPFDETMRTLDRVVASGKVRYLGVSYAPAWKIAQAQTTAMLKDWTPFVGLQIEYSLLQRTIEDELVPMAAELGLGITPWSPLKGGILSCKYNSEAVNSATDSRLTKAGVSLTNKEVAILDKLRELSGKHETTPAAIALAWVLNKPASTSTILGIRTLDQLEANHTALSVSLSVDDMAELDALSAPPPTFVTDYREYARMFTHGGIDINGIKPAPLADWQQMQPGKY
ncbi:aldo/keto reductase [Spirosoma koreense]